MVEVRSEVPVFSAPVGLTRRSVGRRLARIAVALAALLIAAVLGGMLFLYLATTTAGGDLTTATLSVSLSNDVSGDAACHPDSTSSQPRTWSCRAYLSDESGNSAQAAYTVRDRGKNCWTATRVAVQGETERPTPARQITDCVTALQPSNNHLLQP